MIVSVAFGRSRVSIESTWVWSHSIGWLGIYPQFIFPRTLRSGLLHSASGHCSFNFMFCSDYMGSRPHCTTGVGLVHMGFVLSVFDNLSTAYIPWSFRQFLRWHKNWATAHIACCISTSVSVLLGHVILIVDAHSFSVYFILFWHGWFWFSDASVLYRKRTRMMGWLRRFNSLFFICVLSIILYWIRTRYLLSCDNLCCTTKPAKKLCLN